MYSQRKHYFHMNDQMCALCAKHDYDIALTRGSIYLIVQDRTLPGALQTALSGPPQIGFVHFRGWRRKYSLCFIFETGVTLIIGRTGDEHRVLAESDFRCLRGRWGPILQPCPVQA
jgi:hypothetical protein